jgi:hypothetical protein
MSELLENGYKLIEEVKSRVEQGVQKGESIDNKRRESKTNTGKRGVDGCVSSLLGASVSEPRHRHPYSSRPPPQATASSATRAPLFQVTLSFSLSIYCCLFACRNVRCSCFCSKEYN